MLASDSALPDRRARFGGCHGARLTSTWCARIRSRTAPQLTSSHVRTPDRSRHHLLRGGRGVLDESFAGRRETDGHRPRSFLEVSLHLDGVIKKSLVSAVAIGCRSAIRRAAEGVGSRPGSTPFRVVRRHHAARLPGHRRSDQLVRLGMRSGEVAATSLQLDENDRRPVELSVRGGRTLSNAAPLPPDVGRAGPSCSQRGRPGQRQGRA